MKNIFIGFLLILLNLNLTVGNVVVNCIPDFLGYIFILRGLRELEQYSSYFEKAKAYATGLLIYQSISFLADLSGLSSSLSKGSSNSWIILIGIIVTAVTLICSYLIVKGIMEMGDSLQKSGETGKLYSTWKVMAITQVVIYVCIYLIPLLSLVFIFISFLVNILFLVTLNQIKNEFNFDVM